MMLENIPKISAMAFEAGRVRMEAPALAELVPTLRQLQRGNPWLYNSITNSVDSIMEKLASHLIDSDEMTILDIKNQLIWNSLKVADLIDRTLFEKKMQGKMGSDSGNSSNENSSKKRLESVDSVALERLIK